VSAEDRVREMVETIVDAFDVDADVDLAMRGDEIHVTVSGDELGAIIGRDGRVIDAIQHLAYKAASGGTHAGPHVVVDAGGYRERRRVQLARQADEAADEAIRTNREVDLPAMSAIERKVVHEYLRDRGDVETWSEGAEPERHLVVAPAS
jgi:spoIIIJ-associated protein